MTKPILIVMTPVRNEAWVLHAFLKATSLWADHIIIADQMSTDGSREIALSYPKVRLIDNDKPEFNESERQQMLIDKAREIEGDKILFGLDSDEIFSANFIETDDWQKILDSKPGAVFWFKWAEILPNQMEYWESEKTHYPWMFHDDGVEPHGNYVRKMHSMRIPYPIGEKDMHYVNDFRVLHLAYLNTSRVDAKRRFYKFIDWELNDRNIISLSRTYSQSKKEDKVYKLPDHFIYSKPQFDFNLFDEVDTSGSKFWFDDYILKRIERHGKTIWKIDLWDKEFLGHSNLEDQRTVGYKIIHWYLKKTQMIKNKLIIRVIDKVLKILI